MPLTHEEIAEFIGTTRETVTRTLSEFKTRRIISIQGSTLTIPDRTALENIANVSQQPFRGTEPASQDKDNACTWRMRVNQLQ